uniref:ABC transporter ATP-binding protein n=1 Tax=Anisakis simplex TaxID=6269 RepID=A0A0M3JPT6_ANISI
LGEARIDPHELVIRPLVLIVQYAGEIQQVEPRRLERGFADTALSHD